MASVTTLIGLGMPPELANVVADGVVAGNLNVSGTSTLTGAVTASAGIRTKMAINDVDNTTPTNANFEASFGTAAAVGSGFVGIVKDNDANSICYLVVSNGTSFYYLSMTKAT